MLETSPSFFSISCFVFIVSDAFVALGLPLQFANVLFCSELGSVWFAMLKHPMDLDLMRWLVRRLNCSLEKVLKISNVPVFVSLWIHIYIVCFVRISSPIFSFDFDSPYSFFVDVLLSLWQWVLLMKRSGSPVQCDTCTWWCTVNQRKFHSHFISLLRNDRIRLLVFRFTSEDLIFLLLPQMSFVSWSWYVFFCISLFKFMFL